MVNAQKNLPPSRLRLFGVLALGMVSISMGSIFVRWASEAPSLTIAFYRMGTASLLLTPLMAARQGLRLPPQWGRHWVWFSLAGLTLALHFAFWVSSLSFTTVAVSTLLVSISPVLVALLSWLLLGEATTPRALVGIGLAFLGAALLLLNDLQIGDWRGPALALGGAAMIAAYWVAGRRLRRGTGLLLTIYPIYLAAAVLLGVMAWGLYLRLSGFSTATYVALFLGGAVPQVAGHTSYNWALKHLPATTVSTLVLAEPVLASVWAYWLLGESLTPLTLAGGAVVAVGIVLVARGTAAGEG